MKPIIGISVDCQRDPDDARTLGKLTLNWNYADAVTQSGGVPILIPPTADMDVIAQIVDGWLIPGGDDIDASRFGETNHPMVVLQEPARFEAEKRLFAALPQDVPVLGICYGCQFLNVIRGGSLIQHLPDVEGSETHTGGCLQTYRIKEGSRLSEIVGSDSIEGKSYHHQAVREFGRNLEPTAWMTDGTIEALESTDGRWMIGVQWHPERTFQDPKTAQLFREFVTAASRYRTQKSVHGVAS